MIKSDKANKQQKRSRNMPLQQGRKMNPKKGIKLETRKQSLARFLRLVWSELDGDGSKF